METGCTLSDPTPFGAREAIGQRYRRVATMVDWVGLAALYRDLTIAYESLLRPAGVAVEANRFTRVEQLENARAWNAEIGGLVRAVIHLNWAVNHDFLLERFRQPVAQFEFPPELISETLGPPLSDGELGQKIVEAFDACQIKLRERVSPKYKPIEKIARDTAARFRDEFTRLSILGLCSKCGGVIHMACRTKRFCSRKFEGRDCGPSARNRRHYWKGRTPADRTKSARAAAMVLWQRRREEPASP